MVHIPFEGKRMRWMRGGGELKRKKNYEVEKCCYDYFNVGISLVPTLEIRHTL